MAWRSPTVNGNDLLLYKIPKHVLFYRYRRLNTPIDPPVFGFRVIFLFFLVVTVFTYSLTILFDSFANGYG